MRRFFHATFAAGALMPATAGAASMSISEPSGASDWPMTCEAKTCSLTRNLQDSEKGTRAATFFIVLEKDRPDVRLGVVLPLGTALLPGVRLKQNDTIHDVPYEVCFPDGCRAVRDFSESEMGTIASQPSVDIQFFPYGSDAPIFINMPLDGLMPALAEARAHLRAVE
jgi:invasion protein IalB